MRIETKFYAFLRELTGVESDVFVLDDGSTILDFLEAVRAKYRSVLDRICGDDGLLRPGFAVALNGENVERVDWGRMRLKDGDVVVILPPIAGGYLKDGSLTPL